MSVTTVRGDKSDLKANSVKYKAHENITTAKIVLEMSSKHPHPVERRSVKDEVTSVHITSFFYMSALMSEEVRENKHNSCILGRAS